MKDEDPDVVDLMLVYLYTYSDCLGLEWVDEIDFDRHPEICEEMPAQFKYLTSILSTASKYEVHGLVKLVGQKMKVRLGYLELYSPQDEEAMQNLATGLVRSIYSVSGSPALETYQTMIKNLFFGGWAKINESPATLSLMLEYPKMGVDMYLGSKEETREEQRKKKIVISELPKTKRKRYE